MANLKTLEKGKDKNKLNSLIQRFKYLFSILHLKKTFQNVKLSFQQIPTGFLWYFDKFRM